MAKCLAPGENRDKLVKMVVRYASAASGKIARWKKKAVKAARWVA